MIITLLKSRGIPEIKASFNGGLNLGFGYPIFRLTKFCNPVTLDGLVKSQEENFIKIWPSIPKDLLTFSTKVART